VSKVAAGSKNPKSTYQTTSSSGPISTVRVPESYWRLVRNLRLLGRLPPTLSRATYGVTDKEDMRGICFRTKG